MKFNTAISKLMEYANNFTGRDEIHKDIKEEMIKLSNLNIPIVDVRRSSEWDQTGVIPNSILLTFFDEKGKFWGVNTMNPWKKFVVFYFKWLQGKGYIHREGFTAAHHMAIPKRNITTPKLAQPYEASEMLYWYCNLADSKGEKRARSVRGCIVYLVLILFCGIRREEACEVKWEDIDLNGEKIKVLVEGAKKKKRRVNNAEANVWYWFRYCKRKGADLGGFDLLGNGKRSDPLRRLTNRQRQYRESFKEQGKPVPPIVETTEQETVSGKIEAKAANQNIMRHSFISYHMKLYNSAGKTSRVAGNSEREVENTYLELVEDEKDAVSWFAIYPPEVYEKVIDVPDWNADKAFGVYLKLKFMRRSAGMGEEIGDAVQEYERMLHEWEQARDENMNQLAKKIEWFDDPKVKWIDGKPVIKEIDLSLNPNKFTDSDKAKDTDK